MSPSPREDQSHAKSGDGISTLDRDRTKSV